MTSMAQTPPPLRRLFDSLDYAPQPRQQTLSSILEHWQGIRGSAVAPHIGGVALASLAPAAREAAFVFAIVEGDEYRVLAAGSTVTDMLGRAPPGADLRHLPRPRGAARLRRVFEAVRLAGEPILVGYEEADATGAPMRVEVLAAPLLDGSGAVAAILGGVARRAQATSPVRHLPPTPAHREADPLLFAPGSARSFGERVARRLGTSLSALEERVFDDGEHKVRPLVSVRRRAVVVVESLHGEPERSPNDKLCRLLFLVGALKDAGADHVTVVAPYLAYARKDRRTKPRDPVSVRYVAQVLEAIGADCVATVDVHNPAAYENAFRIPARNLSALPLVARHFAARLGDTPTTVVSPDLGAGKRAEAFRAELEALTGRAVAKGFMDKARSAGIVSGDLFAGDVRDRAVVVIDDLIATGTTMLRVARACLERGARAVHVAATHALFAPGSDALWDMPGLTSVVVTDTVPPSERAVKAAGGRLCILGAASLVADAIAGDGDPAM